MDVTMSENSVIHSQPLNIINDVPIYSKTASRRTIAKYLRKKLNISNSLASDTILVDKNRNLIKDSIENFKCPRISVLKSESLSPFPNESVVQNLSSQTFPSNISTFFNNFNINQESNLDDENQENNSSITDMLRCVLEGNTGYVESIEKCNEFQPSWMTNHLPFNYCDQSITCSSLSASIDKQEREIAYNLFVRRIVDETLDRNMIFSHQPKEILNMINAILVRQFSEYEEAKHRGKVRSYLKACRRNSKKNNGTIIMKNTASYLTSGPGNKLMHQIYNTEKEAVDIIKKESERLKLAQNVKQERSIPITSETISPSVERHPFGIINNFPSIVPVSFSTIHTSLKPIAQIFTAQSKINVTQLPLIMPFNSTIHTESVKKTNINSDFSTSDEIIKSICEISKAFVDKESGINVKEIVGQLRATSNFLDQVAKTLEQSLYGVAD